MSIDNLIAFITGVSLASSLISQALKKMLDEDNIKYSSNLLVGLVTILSSILACGGYCVIANIHITSTIIVYGIVIILCSWVGSMVGYDKVTQLLKQIKELK